MKFTKETLKRTVRTFFQSAAAYVLTNIAFVDFTDRSLIKSALIGLVLSGVAAGIAAIMNLETEEQLGSSGMKFSKWVKAYLGKKTDYDGAYGVQCVDLVDCYIEECLGLNIGFHGNAKYWWTNRNKSSWLKKNFDFITPSYKNGELKAGDIGIRTSGTYGHIFVVKEPTSGGKIKYYDQNADGKGAAMTLREKQYTQYVINGVLRPKDRSWIDTASSATTTAVKYNAGSTYVLMANLNVRSGAGASYSIKKVKDLTADGKKNCTSSSASANATLKKGTKVTAKRVVYNGSDIWLQIPSGYIAVYYNGNKYANWAGK